MEEILKEIMLAFKEQRVYRYLRDNYDEIEYRLGTVPNQALIDLAQEFHEKTRPDHLAGYPINWNSKTISVPSHLQTCGIYKMLEDESKKLGISIQLNMLD